MAEPDRDNPMPHDPDRLVRQMLADLLDYAILILDPEGKIRWCNRGASETLGYLPPEMLGLPLAQLFTPRDIDLGRPAHELEEAAAVGRSNDEAWEVRRDGAVFYASGMTMAVHDPAGALRGFVKIFRDRTDRKRFEENLQQQIETLIEADRRKDEFLAILAHELRNPLAPILNALTLLRQGSAQSAAEDEARQMIDRQVRHMARLVDDLLDVSRIATGKVQLHKEPVAVRGLVDSAAEAVRPQVDARNHVLAVSLPAGEIWVEGDRTRLEQVLVNLLNNAAKYTEPGGKISLTVECDPGHASIRVRDTGIGISREMLPHVFDLFMQADRARERSEGGLGIGLALVRTLVELHGGTISAHSAGPGQGSEFVVRLPLASRAVDAPAGPSSSTRPAATRSLDVIVVDDNIDLAVSLSMLLRLKGHRVRTAHNGPDTLAAIAAERPDVIMLDIGLPGMDGYAVAQQVRQQFAAPPVLVAMTGYGQESDRQRSVEAGFDAHLVKPVDPDVVESLLARLFPP